MAEYRPAMVACRPRRDRRPPKWHQKPRRWALCYAAVVLTALALRIVVDTTAGAGQ